MDLLRKCGGSITVEASIVLPIFISAVTTVIFIIKLVFIHEVLQHALNETAEEIAAYSYVYHVSGIQNIHDAVRDGLKNRPWLFRENMSAVFEAYEALRKTPDEASGVFENPLEDLKNAACIMAADTFEDIKTQVCIPLVKLGVKKHLAVREPETADERLKRLNVVDGMEGLDFSMSRFFSDKENNIDIVVRYKVNIPVPFKILPELCMEQRAVCRAWLGGDDVGAVAGDGENPENGDIWSLDKETRGKKLKKIFGQNLPEGFPGISRFDSVTGLATRIASMDLTMEYYKSPKNVKNQIMDKHVKLLDEFKGGKRGGVEVSAKDIKRKEIILVIPENKIKPEIMKAIEECVCEAESRNIHLRIKRYGKKREAGEE